MNWLSKIGVVLISTMVVISQPLAAAALPRNEVENIAKKITVLITRPDNLHAGKIVKTGSGVIIRREDNTYYIVTSRHVTEFGKKYTVVTADGDKHDIAEKDIIQQPRSDTAVMKFTSKRVYEIAKWGDPDLLTKDELIFVYGWPDEKPDALFSSGKFTGHAPLLGSKGLESSDGYNLTYRDAETYSGMSGGPVLDENGRLVGIHGRADLYQRGVSINTFFTDAITLGLSWPNVTYLKICNRHSSKTEVTLAFAKYAGDNGWMTRGWQTILTDACRIFAMGEGYTNKVYYYAKSNRNGANWERQGQELFCVAKENLQESFFSFIIPKSNEVSCTDKNQMQVPMIEQQVSPGTTPINLE